MARCGRAVYRAPSIPGPMPPEPDTSMISYGPSSVAYSKGHTDDAARFSRSADRVAAKS